MQIFPEGLILFGNDFLPNEINLQKFHLSTSGHPALVPLPLVDVDNYAQREDALVVLDHRIVTSEGSTDLKEIDSVISEFYGNLTGFNSTYAVVATWRVPTIVSYKKYNI